MSLKGTTILRNFIYGPLKSMTTAKIPAQRQAEYVQRQKDAGLKQIRNLWAKPEDEARIRAYVARLSKGKL